MTNHFLFDSIRKVKLAYVYYVHFTRLTYLLFVQSLCDHIDKEKWSFLGIHVMISDHMIGMNVAGRMVKQLESSGKTPRDENWVEV